ncbi:IS3 family transposase [Pandoraea sputorum]|uniref:IS3 family transposase n=1 Tax=Pandoraea sputorum TaxID=93222 RepID=UPI0037C7D3ED
MHDAEVVRGGILGALGLHAAKADEAGARAAYIDYYNRRRIKSKLGGLGPVEYRMRAGKN